ncbi:MAG: cell division protein FtsQ/DivIB [Gammaproteobacteria bacterium]
MSMKERQAVRLSADTPSADWLKYALRVLGLAVLLSAFGGLLVMLNDPETLPIKMVRAQGTFSHVTEEMLQRSVGEVSGGYFNVDVNRVQQAVETLPWVAQASVRRVWPDTLAISVREQQALAYWKEEGLVNPQGVVFSPEPTTYPEGLPYFDGPKGMSEMVTQYFVEAQQRLQPLGLSVTRVVLDERRALLLELNHELVLVLGKDQKTARLERFARVYPRVLSDKLDKIARIDLRYPHGMTVEWKQDAVKTQR